MAGNANWQMNIYVANADTSSTAYDTVATSSLTALTGYATKQIAVMQLGEDADFEYFVLQDIGGGTNGTASRRTKLTVECYPFTYNDSASTQDLTDYMDLADTIHNKRFMWVRLTGGTRTIPTTSGHAIPVVLDSWSGQINKEYGTRILTLTFKHRFKY